MANPTIGATTPRIQYTATASQTVFTVPFEFLANADLAVYVNGTLKTLTTDYTLTGANTTGGGSLTFVTGRTAGDIVTILGNLAYSRDTNKYTKYGLLPAEVLEADFDALQVQAKQLALANQFAIRAPLTDTGSPSMTLPVVATRASKVLGFDASGNPTASSSTVTAMDAAVTAINTIAGASSGSSASISHIASGTGAQPTTVQAKLRETVSVKDFGAVGNGIADDTAAIAAAISAVNTATGGVVFFPTGTYSVSAQIVVSSKVKLLGCGHTSDNTVRGASCILRAFTGANATILASGDTCAVESIDIDNNSQGTGECLVLTGTRPQATHVSTRKSGGVGLRIGGTGTNTNLWRLTDIVSLNNASHGLYINDTDAATPDTNAGILVGYDGRSNTGDGLRVNNSIDNNYHGVTCQNNTGYGVNLVGTATQLCQGQVFWFPYTELNTAGEFLFGTYANYCNALFYRSGTSSDAYVDNGTNNFIIGYNATNVSGPYVKNALKFKNVRFDDPAISGYWNSYKDASTRALTFELAGTTADPVNAYFKHSDATRRVRLTAQGAVCGTQSAITFPGAGGAVSIDASRLNWGYLVVTDATAFSINAPTNGYEGQQMTIEVRNLSGGAMGAITWNAAFLLAGAFTNPASNKRRTITFGYSNALWIEMCRAAADI